MIKVGDVVNYTGRLSGHPPREGCVVRHIEGPNTMFNQPMADITKVECWVAIAELEKNHMDENTVQERLFDDKYQRYTDPALQIDKEINDALEPIFKTWGSTGYSFREISHLIVLAATRLECENILCMTSKQLKESKKCG